MMNFIAGIAPQNGSSGSQLFFLHEIEGDTWVSNIRRYQPSQAHAETRDVRGAKFALDV